MTSPAVSTRRPLALVVDHDADTRELYVLHLKTQGIAAEEARDAAQALTKAVAMRPDVITTNLGPMLNGLGLCRELRTHEITRGIPVIAVTGAGMPKEIQQAFDAGCVSVLVKPCLPDDLLSEIRRVLSSL